MQRTPEKAEAMGIASDIVIVVVAALAGGLLAQFLRQPPIVGYILAGVVVGPFTPGVSVGEPGQIALLAELGVALLLFTLGMEFSLKDLRPVRKIAVIGTPIQMVLCVFLGLWLGHLLGLDWEASIWLGAALGPSSTMITLKLLASRGLLGTLSSRVIIGMLIVQDIVTMAFILILPYVGNLQGNWPQLAFAVLRAALFLGAMLFVGARIIPLLMKLVVRWNSRELFLVAVTAMGLGIGYVAYLFGLSFAFGAFLAGLVLSESDYSHQALSDVTPLRDIFAMIFFVSVGMLLDPVFLVDNWLTVVWVVAVVAVVKALIFGGLAVAFGYRMVVPLAVSLALFQLGEFSFVLAREGLAGGVFGSDVYGLILAVALVSTLLTPAAFQAVSPLYALQRRLFKPGAPSSMELPEFTEQRHVVVAGAGRVGQYVARAIQELGLQVVAIEPNQQRVNECKRLGIPVIFGDASHALVLKAARIDQAQVALVTTPVIGVTEAVVRQIANLNPALHVVARADGVEQMQMLHGLGVHEVVQPEFEAGLELARQALLHFDVSDLEIERYNDAVRHELYAPLYDVHGARESLSKLQTNQHCLDFTWLSLPPSSALDGATLGDAGLRNRTGATVVAIQRGETLHQNPDAGFQLIGGDALAILGSPSQISAVEQIARAPGGTPGYHTHGND
jgi:monovalent cation:H+ antiporter-2, CPA2 family